MGGGLLQLVNRDTQKFAMKCSAAQIDGEWIDVYKDPASDPGRRGRRGRGTLWTSGGEFETAVTEPTCWTDHGLGWKDALITVWRDGNLLVETTLAEVRERAAV